VLAPLDEPVVAELFTEAEVDEGDDAAGAGDVGDDEFDPEFTGGLELAELLPPVMS